MTRHMHWVRNYLVSKFCGLQLQIARNFRKLDDWSSFNVKNVIFRKTDLTILLYLNAYYVGEETFDKPHWPWVRPWVIVGCVTIIKTPGNDSFRTMVIRWLILHESCSIQSVWITIRKWYEAFLTISF